MRRRRRVRARASWAPNVHQRTRLVHENRTANSRLQWLQAQLLANVRVRSRTAIPRIGALVERIADLFELGLRATQLAGFVEPRGRDVPRPQAPVAGPVL